MVEREAAVEERAAKFFQCPECHEHFETPDGLGAHLERHREVLPPADPSPRGKPRSVPCPKECGRHFDIKNKKELGHHIPLCDGSAPIAAVIEEPKEAKEEQVAKLDCPKCGREFKHGKRLETHEATCDGSTKTTRKPASKNARAVKPSSNGNGSVFELALAPLRTRREEILAGIPELAEIDGAIAAIEKVKGGG